jgi:hypothetical protein
MTTKLLAQFAAASPRVQQMFGGGADPEWLAAVESWLDGGPPPPPEPPIKLPPEPAPLTAEQRLARYMAEALRRAECWALWHADRAESRGLVSGPLRLLHAARLLRTLHESVLARGISASTVWLAKVIYRSALDQAEHEWADNDFREFARDQVVEVETSHLRTLTRTTVCEIADRRWQMHEGFMTEVEAQLAAADDLAFAPQCPAHGG